MNTAKIISKYVRADGSLDMTAAQLTHELIETFRLGQHAGINALEARLKGHPINERGGKLGVHTVGAKA